MPSHVPDRFDLSPIPRAFVALALLGLSGCAYEVADEAAPDDEVGVSVDPLLGGTNYEGCTHDDRAVLRHAAMMGRTIAQTPAFAECVRNTMTNGNGFWDSLELVTGPYKPCAGDPNTSLSLSGQIDKVIAAARSTNALDVTCADLGGPDASGKTIAGLDPVIGSSYTVSGMEAFQINSRLLSTAHDQLFRNDGFNEPSARTGSSWMTDDTSTIMGTLWHEAMHVHAYQHDDFDKDGNVVNTCKNQTFEQSVPAIVQACLNGVWFYSNCDPCTGHGARIGLDDKYKSTTSTCVCYRDSTPTSIFSFGNTDPPPLVIGTNTASDAFGFAVADGDFNKDGFDDVAVSATGKDSSSGAVYLYQGSVFGLYPWSAAYQDNQALVPGDLYGRSLAVGDFNDDGYDDLAVGMPQGLDKPGAVFLFKGYPNGLSFVQKLDQTSLGTNEAGDAFGWSLASADFDADGKDDLAVGAPNERIGSGARAGAVFLFHGQSGSSSALVTPWALARESPLVTEQNGDRFGDALGAGLLGDRPIWTPDPADLVVGAPNNGGYGRAFFFFGKLSPTATTWSGTRSVKPTTELDSGAHFGAAIALGEFRGRGTGYAAIGAPLHGYQSGTKTGGVYVYAADGSLNQTLFKTTNYQQFGGALAIGEIENLSQQDLIVGATGTSGANKAFIYLGDPSAGLVASSEVPSLGQRSMGSDENGDAFGFSIATGSIDGDQFSDIVIGAPGEAPGSDPADSGEIFTYRVNGDYGHVIDLAAFNQED